MAIIARKACVTGRVQGVWFRKNTRDQAEKLGLSGWAVNADDGSVQVHAQGDEGQVEALMQWLWKGSPLSRVDHVQVQECQCLELDGFTTG